MANGKNNGVQLIESLETGEQKIYNSVFVESKYIDILSNDLAVKIVARLASNKGCAMDLSRDLKQHEQKIYYHLRRLEQAGIIKKVGTERRFGMIAKMYSAVSPIVSTKLYEDGHIIKNQSENKDPKLFKLLSPFIENGKLNAKVVIGDTYSHGRFDAAATETAHAFDFALTLGNFLNTIKLPSYRLDIEITDQELKENNLILIGNARSNVIIDKINKELPVFFDVEKGWHIQSKLTNTSYEDARTGLIIKADSPFNPEKKILIVGGVRTRGAHAAIIAFTRHANDLARIEKDGNLVAIVQGLDKDGDKILDDIKFVEPSEI